MKFKLEHMRDDVGHDRFGRDFDKWPERCWLQPCNQTLVSVFWRDWNH